MQKKSSHLNLKPFQRAETMGPWDDTSFSGKRKRCLGLAKQVLMPQPLLFVSHERLRGGIRLRKQSDLMMSNEN